MSHVLVIDDDVNSRRLIVRALEKWGIQTIECANGRQGWEMLWENNSISMVITDMIMPDMDGRELMHLVRSQEEMKGMPVIMISGYLSVEELQPIISISPQNTFFISKPLDLSILKKYFQALGQLGTQSAEKLELPH